LIETNLKILLDILVTLIVFWIDSVVSINMMAFCQ